ncbi:hypothetical protein Ae717Ps2_7309 [Pseudonocardia sp. Ae717_Ps2]|nr:hypothetical protein Ae717Ps2_7309 [Pseudonocardia sp. Ae717_Ps2]
MSEVAASASDSGVGAPAKKRKRGRVSFSSDVFAEETSLHALADGGASSAGSRCPTWPTIRATRVTATTTPRSRSSPTAFGSTISCSQRRWSPRCLPCSLSRGRGSARDRVVGGPHRKPPARSRPPGRVDPSRGIGRDRLGGADPMLAEATLVENIHRQDLPHCWRPGSSKALSSGMVRNARRRSVSRRPRRGSPNGCLSSSSPLSYRSSSAPASYR